MSIRQLVLDLTPPVRTDFASFVPGRNGELVAALLAVAHGVASERFFYLWGAPGSGRTHLLSALAARAVEAGHMPVRAFSAPVAAQALEALDPPVLVLIDDVERLTGPAEQALFGLYNRLRDGAGALVACGDVAPSGLKMRADLVTRLAWGLVYEVHALRDEDKVEAMRTRARALGYRLPDDVAEYLLRHAPRDLTSLLRLVDRLDRHAIASRRAVTLPLARTLLQHAFELEDDH